MKYKTVSAKARRIDQIVATIAALDKELAKVRMALVNQLGVSPGKVEAVKKRRKMTKAARAKIAAAQRARWAKIKAKK